MKTNPELHGEWVKYGPLYPEFLCHSEAQWTIRHVLGGEMSFIPVVDMQNYPA